MLPLMLDQGLLQLILFLDCVAYDQGAGSILLKLFA